MQEELAILDKQIDRQEHYSRRNCIPWMVYQNVMMKLMMTLSSV